MGTPISLSDSLLSFKDQNGLIWYADQNGLRPWGIRYYKSTDCSGPAYVVTIFANMAVAYGGTLFKTAGPIESFVAPSAKSDLVACEKPPAYTLSFMALTPVGPFVSKFQPPYSIQ